MIRPDQIMSCQVRLLNRDNTPYIQSFDISNIAVHNNHFIISIDLKLEFKSDPLLLITIIMTIAKSISTNKHNYIKRQSAFIFFLIYGTRNILTNK